MVVTERGSGAEDEVRRSQRAAEDGHGRHPHPGLDGADERRGERGHARAACPTTTARPWP